MITLLIFSFLKNSVFMNDQSRLGDVRLVFIILLLYLIPKVPILLLEFYLFLIIDKINLQLMFFH